MGDYLLAEHLMARLGLSPQQLEQAQQAGFAQPVEKNGHTFYSATQAYKLRAACNLMEKKGYTWERALVEMMRGPLYQVSKA